MPGPRSLTDARLAAACAPSSTGDAAVWSLTPQVPPAGSSLCRRSGERARRVTVPLRAGDRTFDNARLAHSATPNLTGDLAMGWVWPRGCEFNSGRYRPQRYAGGGHGRYPPGG
ncbi:hypothetical protein GCM10023195_00400 [Actinoallomurus liliacearum]|uniref:Uncharacterized protein n=1 Tax=Actinoallomurus liliacearum TaxID=1080073 RepID=A0ABP8TBW2_9ACTN